MKYYDLRSDTFTVPCAQMRRAIYEAEVGDDLFAEDPSVNRLQERAAAITGKEAALYLPSGTMGNLLALYILGGRGNEVLLHHDAHILHHEMAGATALAGVLPVTVSGSRGVLPVEELRAKLKKGGYGSSRTTLVTIENTHNQAGGTCWQSEELAATSQFCNENGLSLHMDGARIFNASIATNTPVKEIAQYADSVTFCLSKGLGGPVGSCLCGKKEYIAEATEIRKMLGGSMRQIGFMAAAGIYALENNIERLPEDHINAQTIADTLSHTKWASLNRESVETNIIYFDTPNHPAEQVVKVLGESGILSFALGERVVRFVTSLLIDREDTKNICRIIGECGKFFE